MVRNIAKFGQIFIFFGIVMLVFRFLALTHFLVKFYKQICIFYAKLNTLNLLNNKTKNKQEKCRILDLLHLGSSFWP